MGWVEDLGKLLDEGNFRATFTGWKKELVAEEKKTKILRKVLERHHQWHQDIGAVKLIHDDGKETELDLSLEYSDSSLCDETIEALAFDRNGQ